MRFFGAVTLAVVVVGCSSQNNLEWVEEEGYRWAEVSPGFFGSTGFSELASEESGIEFVNRVGTDLMQQNRHYLNGSGVAVADIDGDGLQDVYFAGVAGPNKLYRNLGGLKFEDITEKAGLSLAESSSTGVVFSDVNGDGSPDLLVSSLADSNALYINDGKGNFSLKEDSGLGAGDGAMSMALADINGDGSLDLYIANYKFKAVKDLYDAEELTTENTTEVVDGRVRVLPEFSRHYHIVEMNGGQVRVERGTEDELYLNDGTGTFTQADPMEHFFDEAGRPAGLSADWGLTATFRDINSDGYPDLYVANDFWTPDRFWINRGDGTFRPIDGEAVRSLSYSAMGVDFSDIDRDGYLDYAVTEMLSREHDRRLKQVSQNRMTEEGIAMVNRNSVYLNRGDMTFSQIADYSGLHATEWSWATYFMDVDLDGYEDLLVANGYPYDYLDMDTQFRLNEQARMRGFRSDAILDYPSLELTNMAFRNNADYTFSEVSEDWGFTAEDISHGMALADFDNDGDLDLAVNRFNEVASLFENDTDAPRIAVRLKGSASNPAGVGAKIVLEGGAVRQSKEVVAGGNYLSGSQPMAVFAANGESGNYVIKVAWPDGKTSRIEGVSANRIYEIDKATGQGAGEVTGGNDRLNSSSGIFDDISERIAHRHHENEFDDFAIQPLLPHKLSRQGPGVAWVDVDGDGLDDLFIGTGMGGEAGLYRNDGSQAFTSFEMGDLTDVAETDQTGITSWKEDDHTYFVIGNSMYDSQNKSAPSAILMLISPDGSLQKVNIPGSSSVTGPLAAADIDGNGYNDLFIGGYFKPGRYPENAESRLILNDDGSFSLDQMNANLLSSLGLVTSAVFTDYNLDNQPDLLISNEWGSLKLLENDQGTFVDVTDQVGLDRYKGWWRGVATGDFNNDGRPDIIATNIGLNNYYNMKRDSTLRLYYNDFNWDGLLATVDSYYDEEAGGYVPRRRLTSFGSVPSILNQVKSHAQFSEYTLSAIFGTDFSNIPYREINTLQHMLFINTPDGFKATPLPAEAQFSAASYAGVFDYDNDGYEDLFLSQNYFAFPKPEDRVDAGRGLLLKGDGNGGLTPVSGKESGIKIYGDQRGAAYGDFDGDGRTDLAVSQNGGATKLYRNTTGKQGFRVSLIGPAQNQDAIGSAVRLLYADGSKGPVREIQAGSGYWSQNSRVQVMGIIEGKRPESLEVTWFDGRVKSVPIEEGVMNYRVSY